MIVIWFRFDFNTWKLNPALIRYLKKIESDANKILQLHFDENFCYLAVCLLAYFEFADLN